MRVAVCLAGGGGSIADERKFTQQILRGRTGSHELACSVARVPKATRPALLRQRGLGSKLKLD